MDWVGTLCIVALLVVGVLMFPAVVIAARWEMERDRRESDEWIKQFRAKFRRK